MDNGIAGFERFLDVKPEILMALGAVGGTASQYFGGWDTAMATLLIVMAVDWVTGMLLASVFKKSGKTVCGALRSDVGFIGITKKVMVLFIVLVSHQVDVATGTDFIRNAVILAYTVNEIVSIIENAGLMGVPIPKPLRNAIEVLRKQTDAEDDTAHDTPTAECNDCDFRGNCDTGRECISGKTDDTTGEDKQA